MSNLSKRDMDDAILEAEALFAEIMAEAEAEWTALDPKKTNRMAFAGMPMMIKRALGSVDPDALEEMAEPMVEK